MVSAVSGKSGVEKPKFVDRARTFFQEVWVELKKARWPTRDELLRLTAVVVATVVIVALLIAGVDFVMARLTEAIGVFPKLGGS